ncbi:MAG: nucleotidyltransferase domain-containing protein [candidate division KSB1 bacterium]|nr:nucleotidyltransferase domain-containing protein [candidate division KSB1 bacterium]
MEVSEIKKIREYVSQKILSRGDYLQQLEAIGIFGSLARTDFTDRSDIDIFVVVDEVKDQEEETEKLWYDRISDLLTELHRDVTVLVYSIKALTKVATWHTIRLASEGILLYDKGKVKNIFEAIVKEAKRVGLVEKKFGRRKVWMMGRALKRGEIIEVTLEK